MDLDDTSAFPELDQEDMLGQINGLPDQLEDAWNMGLSLSLPDWSGIQRVVISGMGGSAIGADLLNAYIEDRVQVPVIVHRDYGLPAWASGPETLMIASSHSGNTEETLSGFQIAVERGCRTLAITTNGKLRQAAQEVESGLWIFEHSGQPRAAVGFSFGLLLAAFTRLGLIPDPGSAVQVAARAMRHQQETLKPEVPVIHNPAKRLAGQLIGRWVVIMGSDLLAPVARRWKGQISEVAKAWAQFEFLPEANHNTLAGTQNPEALFNQMMAIFLRAPSNQPRDLLRSEITQRTFLLEGMNADAVEGIGDTPIEQLWTCLHFGDYTAYYLAMAYGVDPTPVAALESLKKELKARP